MAQSGHDRSGAFRCRNRVLASKLGEHRKALSNRKARARESLDIWPRPRSMSQHSCCRFSCGCLYLNLTYWGIYLERQSARILWLGRPVAGAACGHQAFRDQCISVVLARPLSAAEREFSPSALSRSLRQSVPFRAKRSITVLRTALAAEEVQAQQVARPVWALPPDQYRTEYSGIEGGEQARAERRFFLVQLAVHRERNDGLRCHD